MAGSPLHDNRFVLYAIGRDFRKVAQWCSSQIHQTQGSCIFQGTRELLPLWVVQHTVVLRQQGRAASGSVQDGFLGSGQPEQAAPQQGGRGPGQPPRRPHGPWVGWARRSARRSARCSAALPGGRRAPTSSSGPARWRGKPRAGSGARPGPAVAGVWPVSPPTCAVRAPGPREGSPRGQCGRSKRHARRGRRGAAGSVERRVGAGVPGGSMRLARGAPGSPGGRVAGDSV